MFESLDRVRVSFLFVKERVEDIVEIETFLASRISTRIFINSAYKRARIPSSAKKEIEKVVDEERDVDVQRKITHGCRHATG